MRVEIGEVASSVQMVDGDSLLEPRTLERVVQAVLQALEERALHDKRAGMERGVWGGIAGQREHGG